jgi:hypothetical protein
LRQINHACSSKPYHRPKSFGQELIGFAMQ